MPIALDARWLQQPLHGIARYTLNLLRYLPLDSRQPLLVLYNREDFEPAAEEGLERPGLIWIDCRIPLFAKEEAWAMTRLLRRLKPRLLHVPAYWKPYASPSPWLMTVHDLIHLDEPKLKYRMYYRWLCQQLRSAAAVITVSQASALGIKAWSGVDAEVTYPGVEARYRPGPPEPDALSEWGVRCPFFLYVGNPKPHKRAELALQASALLRAPHQLVSVGLPASGQADHLALQAVPEALMPTLYRTAVALLLPSRAEGFGLPGAEATACACPVLATDLPVLREVVPAAVHLPPDPSAWAQAMARVLDQPPELIDAALEARRRFGCEELGQRTAAIYRQVLDAT